MGNSKFILVIKSESENIFWPISLFFQVVILGSQILFAFVHAIKGRLSLATQLRHLHLSVSLRESSTILFTASRLITSTTLLHGQVLLAMPSYQVSI